MIARRRFSRTQDGSRSRLAPSTRSGKITSALLAVAILCYLNYIYKTTSFTGVLWIGEGNYTAGTETETDTGDMASTAPVEAAPAPTPSEYASSGYWLARMKHQGFAAFNGDPQGYQGLYPIVRCEEDMD